MDGTICSVSVRLFPIPAGYAPLRPFANAQLTSSVQVVACLVSLLNDFNITNSNRTLGFLNPLLYSNGRGRYLKDVLYGSDPGCGTNGFRAKFGWDPVRSTALVSFFWVISTSADVCSILGHRSRDAEL